MVVSLVSCPPQCETVCHNLQPAPSSASNTARHEHEATPAPPTHVSPIPLPPDTLHNGGQTHQVGDHIVVRQGGRQMQSTTKEHTKRLTIDACCP